MLVHPSRRAIAYFYTVAFLGLTIVSSSIAQTTEDVAASRLRSNVHSEFTVGVYKLENGMVLEAVDHLEYAWRLSVSDPSVGLRLADAYFLLKNFTRSEIVIDEILAGDRRQPHALLFKAKLRYLKRDVEAAIAMLERLRDIGASTFESERLLGNACYEIGEDEKAIAAYERCIRHDPSYPYIYLRYGRLLVETSDGEGAEKAFRRALSLDAGFSEAAVDLAELLLKQGRTDEGLAVLERALLDEPTDTRALLQLATMYQESGRLEPAIRLLERIGSARSLPREARVVLGRLYFDTDRFEKAFDVFSQIFEQEGPNDQIARILGELSLKLGETGRALEFYRRAIEIAPEDFHNHLGLFVASQDEYVEGKAIELSPEDEARLLTTAAGLVPEDDFEGNYVVGVALLGADSLDAAQAHLLKANELRPNDRSILISLASIHEKRSEYVEAEGYLSELFERSSDDPSILNFYAYLLAQMKVDLPRAEKMARAALKHDPDNGYYLDSLGWIYYQMGEYAGAVAELERASDRVKDDPTILEHLGDAYKALERFDEAKTAYEESNRVGGESVEILEKIQSASRPSE